jgi:membrane-associated phospholipid phosphatase
MLKSSRPFTDTPRLLQETPTGRLSVRQVFPPRRAMARGRGAIVVVTLALAAFAVLFALVRRNRSRLFDLRITRSLQRVSVPGFDVLMRLVSWPGFPPQSRIIPPAAAGVWLLLGFPVEAGFQLFAWGAGGISAIVKFAMGRPRPAPEDVRVVPGRIGGSSFPSGHVLIYSGVYGFLAFLIETLVRPRRIRRAATTTLVAFIALVGPSRIYLGHHWFTDVIASYLLGGSYLLAMMALYRRVKTRWLNNRRGLADFPASAADPENARQLR